MRTTKIMNLNPNKKLILSKPQENDSNLLLFLRDLCYFLYVNTDAGFRKKNLDLCLRSYYSAFSHYFDSTFLKEMNFEKFEKEFQERRALGLIWGILVSMIPLLKSL